MYRYVQREFSYETSKDSVLNKSLFGTDVKFIRFFESIESYKAHSVDFKDAACVCWIWFFVAFYASELALIQTTSSLTGPTNNAYEMNTVFKF